MTQDDLEARILSYLNSQRGSEPQSELTPELLGLEPQEAGRLNRTTVALWRDGYISGKFFGDADGGTLFFPEIRKAGQTRLNPPPSDSQTINIFGGNNQIGNYNRQEIDSRLVALLEVIEASDAPAEQKKEALSLLARFAAHPIVGNALQGGSLLTQILQGGG
ncbi:MAG TPA: hypothetical protein EYQ24_00470 [Bacteroidetes bacterium]|nr:hypothetical protein [Bacteroidota bacterium]HIL58279.1 hypothetical protein [Rhodothermales bacterium]